MNRLKFLLATFVAAFVTFGIYSCAKEEKSSMDKSITSQSDSFGESCLEATSCSPYLPEIINNVTLPSYPGCVFRVRVSVCVQQDIILGTEIFVSNYELLDATDCPELWEEWSNLVLDPESQAGEINEFVNNLDQQVYARLENYLYAKHGNKVGCGSPLGTLTVSFIKASCSTICSHQYEQNPYPKDGGDGSFDNEVTESRLSDKYGTLVRANCDTNGCCQRRTSICYNPEKDEVEKTTTSHPTPGATCLGGVVDTPPAGVLVNCLPCSFSCN